MEVILSRDVKNVGKVGDVCTVKTGYGRNFLIPKGYAIVANKKSVAKLQEQLADLKQRNDELSATATNVASIIENKVFNIVRQASDDRVIYGSVRNRDIRSLICELLHESRISFSIDVGSIKIDSPIKSLGRYLMSIDLFADVSAKIRLNVSRTAVEFDNTIEDFDEKYQAQFEESSSDKNKQSSAAQNTQGVASAQTPETSPVQSDNVKASVAEVADKAE